MDPRIDLKFVFEDQLQTREYDGKKQPSSLDLAPRAPINGEYYPAGVLAKEFDYAVDHVSWLARTGKVQALRKGKRWYVTRASLQAYKESAKVNQSQSGLKSQEVVLSSVNKSTYRKADITPPRSHAGQAVSSFILAGGLLIFYILNLGIVKINFNNEPLTQGYQSVQASLKDFTYELTSLWAPSKTSFLLLKSLSTKLSSVTSMNPPHHLRSARDQEQRRSER